MRLKVIRDDQTLNHVALLGRLDVQGVNDVQYDFLRQTTSVPKPTMVDLSGVPFIASVGIGMLFSAAKHLERHGVRLVLLNPSDGVRKAFDTAALGHVIPIATEETAALALLG
jgi:anti-anti-sigma factor